MKFKVLPYADLLNLARRHARRVDDAPDIVQDVLIAALQTGRLDFSLAPNRRWAAGAIRKRAAFDARSALRRQRRDARYGLGEQSSGTAAPPEDLTGILTGLPPGLRLVAALSLSGHSRKEVAYLLGLSDTAMRQRVRALKKALVKKGVQMPAEMSGLTLDLAYGAIRAALLPALQRHGGRMASHDPDGHLFVFRSSQNR